MVTWRLAGVIAGAMAALVGSVSPMAAPQADPLVVLATGEATDEAVLDHLRAGLGDRFTAEITTPREVAAATGSAWFVSVPGELEACREAALSNDEIDKALAEAETALQTVDHETAARLLDDLEQRLCACTEPLADDVVARIPYLQGLVAYYAGDMDVARRCFRTAAERQPDITWDNNFAPDPQQLFLEALGEAVRSPRTVVSLPAGEWPRQLAIDGVVLAQGAPPVELVGRAHLVQFRDAGDEVSSRVLDTNGAEVLTLYGPATLGAHLTQGPRDEAGALALATLWSLVSAPDHRDVVVLASPGAYVAWRRGAGEAIWSPVTLVMSPQLERARTLRRTGGVLIVAGIVTAVAGAGLAGGAASAGNAVLDEMTLPDGDISGGMWDLRHEDYERDLQANRAGWVVVGVGAAVAIAGLPFLAAGGTMRREAEFEDGTALMIGPGPGDVGLSVCGRWP